MTQHLWYLRRLGVTSGPFPAGQLREMFVQGELGPQDEVSLDGRFWQDVIEAGILGKHPALAQLQEASDEAWFHEREKARRRWVTEANDPDAGQSQDPSTSHLLQVEQETRELIDAHVRERPALLGGLALIGVLLLAGLGVWFGQTGGFSIQTEHRPQESTCARPAADGVVWAGCDKNDAKLPHANLRNADLKGTRLERADLAGADLSYADLQTADLRGANLRGTRLKAVNLSQADLTGADLTGADLSYAVLTGAQLDGVRLDGAILGKTTWIDGRVCGEQSVGACR